MSPKRKKLTPEQRAALDARDARLMAGLRAKDPAATDEAMALVKRYLGDIAKRRARWLLRQQRWNDACQAVFALVARWQDENRLREDESIWRLAQRALKQVAESMSVAEGRGKDVKWARLSFSLDDASAGGGEREALEDEVARSVHSPQRYQNPEKLAADREMVQWLAWAEEKLSEDDQRVVNALVAVEEGREETLGEALGIEAAAARKRHQRLRERYGRIAIAEGNLEMARRCAGKKYADALELLFVAEPGADHRIDELVLLRDGDLETARKIELERHLAICPACRRSLRTLEQIDEALLALLLLPPPDFDPGGILSAGKAGRPRGSVWKWGVAVAVVAALGLWWLGRGTSETVPPPPPPRRPPPAATRPARAPEPLLMSPSPDHGRGDAGK
ncbi:MAG: zf-HC2 domain-containing protein [Myxococcales bacterium]